MILEERKHGPERLQAQIAHLQLVVQVNADQEARCAHDPVLAALFQAARVQAEYLILALTDMAERRQS